MNPKCPYKSFLNSTQDSSDFSKFPKDLPGEDLIDDTLLTINPSSINDEKDNNSKCPYSNKQGNISGCPFMNSQNTEPKDSKFSFHYEIPLPQKGRDFYFNKLNYTKETLAKSTWLHSMPFHLRNTLFIKDEKLDLIRKKEYSVVFLITEEMKEKANELYEKKEYNKAIGAYTLIYSVFKWLVFKSKEKETKCIKEYEFSNENAIIDEDVELKRIATDSSLTYEEDSYRTCVIYILKSLSYCYIHLRAYTEAAKCMEEAIGYASASLPDVLLRKSQAIMYNKFSSELLLSKALSDMQTAKNIKKTKMIEDHLAIISTIIDERKKQRFNRVKELIESTAYANNVINTKKLNVHDHIYYSYDEIHFNHQIVIEMKDLYYSTIKFFQDTNNAKQLENMYVEFDKFFDFYYPYMSYYQLTLSNIQQDILEQLTQEDIELIKEGEKNQTIRLLFNDFRLKKCQELYNNMEWNMQLWKFCFDIVHERDKEKKKEEEKNKKASQSLYKKLSSPFSNSSHYIIFSLILITASIVFIGFHYIYYNKQNNKPI